LPLQSGGWLFLAYDTKAQTAEIGVSTIETNRGFSSPSVVPLLAFDLHDHACEYGESNGTDWCGPLLKLMVVFLAGMN
jgi:superoxide dismutase